MCAQCVLVKYITKLPKGIRKFQWPRQLVLMPPPSPPRDKPIQICRNAKKWCARGVFVLGVSMRHRRPRKSYPKRHTMCDMCMRQLKVCCVCFILFFFSVCLLFVVILFVSVISHLLTSFFPHCRAVCVVCVVCVVPTVSDAGLASSCFLAAAAASAHSLFYIHVFFFIVNAM